MSQHNSPLRLSLVALMGGVLLAGTPAMTAQAQTTPTTLTVSFKEKDLWTVLNYVVQKGGYQLEGGEAVRQSSVAVTVDFDETTPEAALALLFKNTPFSYSLQGKQLRVMRNAVATPSTSAQTGTTNATLCTAHGKTREDGFVLPMQHIEFIILIATATIVFVETLKGVLDTCEVGDATIYGFQEIIHREESSIEGRDVIIVERKFGSG